jgi:hypothetical protein
VGFILSLAVPAAIDAYVYKQREVPATVETIYELDLKADWLKIREELDLPENLRLENFNCEVGKDKKINYLSYQVMGYVNNQFTVYQIRLQHDQQSYSIIPIKSEEWAQYYRLVSAERFFTVFEQLDFNKILPDDFPQYIIASRGAYQSFSTEYASNYLLAEDEIIPLEIEDLPVEGYEISFHGNRGDSFYFFDYHLPGVQEKY